MTTKREQLMATLQAFLCNNCGVERFDDSGYEVIYGPHNHENPYAGAYGLAVAFLRCNACGSFDCKSEVEVEVEIPSHYEVCGRCNGSGEHDCFEGGITSSEWSEWSDDERADYHAGRYSVTCSECGGLRVELVPEAINDAMPERTKAILAAYESKCDNDARYAQEEASMRRAEMGWA